MTRLLPLLLLTGCTTWERVGQPSENIRWVETEAHVVRAIPGCERWDTVACAIPFPEKKTCVILSATAYEKTAQFIKDHEKKHCEGFRHD